MNFSRLNPRSQRTGMSRRRTPDKRLNPPARHLRLWEAIRRTREEITQWQERVDQVDGLFRHHILPREEQLTFACGLLTDRLMDNYDQMQLALADQTLLGLWIAENLQSLNAHPFASEIQRDTLNRRWHQLQPARGHLFSQAPAHQPEDELDEHDMLFDFGWHAGAADHKEDRLNSGKNSGADSEEDTGTDTWTDTGEDAGHKARKEPDPENHDSESLDSESLDARISELDRRLSVDRLFRQLARVLHPDRESDKAQQEIKNELMSRCLKARQEKDIDTLLRLYCDHIGDLPDDLSASDHDELIKALELQLLRLQRQLRQQRFADPLRAQIMERYNASTSEQCLQRVHRHARSLDVEIEQLQMHYQQLDSEECLLDALMHRRAVELDRMEIDQLTGYSR